MLSLLLLCAAIAAPFEDVQHRFHLTLPPQWRFTPLPGDIHGATFHREADGGFANATVRVMPFDGPVELDTFVSRIAAAADGEPGFRLMARENSQVAGYPGVKRRFLSLVNGDPRLPKMVEQQIVVVGNTGYVVHAEALADVFATFAADIAAIEASFAPGGVGPLAPGPRLHRRDLIGAWQAAGHALMLTQGGAISLDGAHGTFRLESGTLVATFGHTTKIYQLDVTARHLTLSGQEFAQGVQFRRHGHRPRPHL